MMLAELSAYDPPILISAILGCGMFLVMLANAAMDFWRNIKDRPTGSEVLEKARAEFQPRGEYQPKGDYISRHEFHEFKKSLAAELQNISAENKTILKAGEKRELHLASLIEALDSRIDDLPAKMVKHMTETIELYEKFQATKKP